MLLHRFAGDVAELGIIRAGEFMKVKAVLNPRVHLVSRSRSWSFEYCVVNQLDLVF